MENLTKVCTKCDLRKPIYEYARKASSSRDGFQNICKECDKERHRIYRENNPEKEKERCRLKELRYKENRLKDLLNEGKSKETLQPKITELSQSNINSIQSYLNNNQMEFKVVKLNPELATEMLKNNNNNRNISRAHVLQLSSQMKDKAWNLNGESIKISKKGKILDGQHRLNAIIHCGLTIEMLVISNLEEDVFATLDTGKKRTGGDVLCINNIQNSSLVAGAIRLICIYTQGKSFNYGGHFSRSVTNKQILEFESIYNISQYAPLATSWYKKNRIITPSQFLFLHHVLSRIDNEDCIDFLEKLSSGTNLSEKHPVKVLRDKILKYKGSSLTLPASQLYAFIFKSWNYFREGKEITTLQSYSDSNANLILK